MLAYTTHQHANSEQAFVFGTVVVLLGKLYPTAAVLDRPMRLVGTNLVPAALEKGWKSYAVPKRLKMPYPHVSSCFQLVEQPAKFVDVQNRVQPLKEFRDAIGFCGEEVAKDLRDFGQWFKGQQTKLDDPQVGQEYVRRVQELTGKHEALLGVLDPHQPAPTLLRDKPDLVELLTGIDAKATTATLVAATTSKLAAVQKVIDTDGAALKQDFAPYLEALTGLSLFCANGGHQAMAVYLVNCRDVNEVLALYADELVALLSRLKGAHHIDVGLLNRVSGGTENLKKLGNALDKKLRACVWATLGGIANEEHAVKVAENNPLLATAGAGSVFTFVGTARHRGYPTVISAAVLGKRIDLDQRYNDDEAGPMTHHFGPQSSKHLEGIDDLDTLEWDFATLKMLAKEAGLNAATRHSNGIISPYLARTLSALEHYRFIDASRLANMLTGFAMAYLDVKGPSLPNIPRVQRDLCEGAEAKFFGPFKDRPGFAGSLKPLPSSRGTRFELAIEITTPDPIEEIVVVRRHVPINSK